MDKTTALCCWLIDWGFVPRPFSPVFTESEYHVFDDIIYRRYFPSTTSKRNFIVEQCGHDVADPPTRTPIHNYVWTWKGRAFPVRGAGETPSSAIRGDTLKWGTASAIKFRDEVIRDESTRPLILNTYTLKLDLYGWVDQRIEVPDVQDGLFIGKRMVPLIHFPEDVSEDFVNQCASEYLTAGKRPGERVWKHKGPNHYADCWMMAYGMAHNLNIWQRGQTDEEANPPRPPAPRPYQPQSKTFATPDGRPYLATER
jgi:hypothetical protein